mgnify:CR=1 FL=1
MPTMLGLDIGTSGAKAVVVHDDGAVIATGTADYPISHPHPLWSEQDPADWWAGAQAALTTALDASGTSPDDVAGLGLTGQMHGAVFLDEADAATREYIRILDVIAASNIERNVSLKLTQLGLDLDPGMARRHLAGLANRALELGAGRVWIDMEGSDYTEATVALYEQIIYRWVLHAPASGSSRAASSARAVAPCRNSTSLVQTGMSIVSLVSRTYACASAIDVRMSSIRSLDTTVSAGSAM